MSSSVQNTLKFYLVPAALSAVILSLFLGIVGSALLKPKPHNLPVAVIAPAPVIQQLKQGLDQKAPGALDIQTYTDAQAARTDLKRQKVYGVVEVGRTGLQLTTASASTEAARQLVTQVFTGAAQANHLPITVADSTPKGEAPGAPIIALFLFLITSICALLTQTLIQAQPQGRRLATWLSTTLLTSVVIGLTGSGLVIWLLNDFQSTYWAVAGIVSLLAFTSAAIIAGCESLLGRPGMGIAVLALVPLGVATAGAMFDYHFLPDFYRQLSQSMPAGATITALRQVLYFDSAAVMTPVAIISYWALAGLVLVIAGFWLRSKKKRSA
jgi:energy-converting hydrogenase Eha subunit A